MDLANKIGKTENYMKLLLTLFILIVAIKPMFAGDSLVWNLEKCVNRAMQYNLAMQQGVNIEKKAQFDYVQSKWDLAPSISGRSNGSLDLRRSTNQNNQITSGASYNIGYGLSASFNLFSGFSAINRIAAMRFNALVYNESNDQAENNLYIDVLSAYSTCLFQKELIKISDEKMQISLHQKEKIEALISSGLRSQSSINEVLAIVSSNKLNQLKAKNNYLLQKLQFAQLLEIEDSVSFEIDENETQFIEPIDRNFNIDDVYYSACENYPSIKEKEYALQYYHKIMNIRKGALLPNLSLYGGYNSSFYSTDTLQNGRNSPIGDQFSKYLNPSLGLSLSIPIFSGRSRFYQLKKSKIDVENAVLELEKEKNQVRKEIQEALQRLNANLLEYRYAIDNLHFIEKSFAEYNEKYELGLITSIEFNTAQTQWAEAKTAVLSAKFNWIIQDKTVQLYMGRMTDTGNGK